MENLIQELNGIKYLAVEIPVTDENQNKVTECFNKFELIYVSILEYKKNSITVGNTILPSTFFAKVKVLVPEKHIIEFNKIILLEIFK